MVMERCGYEERFNVSGIVVFLPVPGREHSPFDAIQLDISQGAIEEEDFFEATDAAGIPRSIILEALDQTQGA